MFDRAVSCRDLERIVEIAKEFRRRPRRLFSIKLDESLRRLCEILEIIWHPKPNAKTQREEVDKNPSPRLRGVAE
jgi:hypothetical protein